MKLYLIAAKGKQQGTPIPIKIDLFLMGSDAVCQLRSQLPGVGPRHCALVTRDRKAFVQDLNSETTWVNGEALPRGMEWPLHAGDRLRVGPLEFLVALLDQQLGPQELREWAALLERAAAVEEEVEQDEEAALLPSLGRPRSASDAAAAILGKFQAKRGVVKGRLRISQDDSLTTYRFNERNLVEEAEVALIKRELVNHLKRPTVRTLLDFKNVRRLSAAAAEMVADVYRDLKARDVRLALCRVQPELMPVLKALAGLRSVPHFPDKKTAKASRW